MSNLRRAMIFSAGLGTRFKPWTDHHPKALAKVNGKSLLQHNIQYLQRFGINEVVVNVHHFADQIIEALEEHEGWGSKFFISDETSSLLETGGGLLHAREYLEQESFLSINVDVLTALNLHAIIDHFKTTQAFATLSIQNRKTSRYFLWNQQHHLCGWRNVQTGEERIVHPANDLTEKAYTCVAVYHPRIFDHIEERGKFSLTGTFLNLSKHHLINGYDHTGDDWVDVGRPESVVVAEEKFA